MGKDAPSDFGPEILVEVDGAGVATLTLNRPDRLNAMNRAMMDLLTVRLDDLAQNPSVRCVVVTGAGRAFSSGGDVGLIRERQARVGAESSPGAVINEQLQQLRRNSRAVHMLLMLAVPTVAMLNGAAVGGGLAMALACDFRVAAAGAKVRIGYARVGLSGDFGISYLLQQAVGGAKARELLMLDPDMLAEDALTHGIVHRVVPGADLVSEVQALASRLAAGPTIAYGKIKENLLVAATGDLNAVLLSEAVNSRITAMSADCREGVAALAEKRQPRFIGG